MAYPGATLMVGDLNALRADALALIAALDAPEGPQARSQHDVIQEAVDRLRERLGPAPAPHGG